jgi:hypothetical protein
MFLKIEKAILSLLTGVFPVFIAACYGSPMYEGPELFDVEGVVKDPSGNPLPEIKVTCLKASGQGDSTYTMAGDGAFYLTELYSPCESLLFEDVDGDENGGLFAPREIPVTIDDEPLEVTLELEE